MGRDHTNGTQTPSATRSGGSGGGWMGWLALLAGLLFVLAIPLFLVTGSVTWALNDAGLYNGGFERYDVARRTGITNADLRRAGADIRHYFNSGQELLELRAPVYGVEREIFNEREVAHMRDVKGLVRGVYLLAALSLAYILAATAAGFRWRGWAFVGTLARLVMSGGGLTLALLVAMGALILTAFDALFLAFHLVSFSNDFWQLDPRSDYLIIMFPQGFWFDATARVAITTTAGALSLAGLSGAYLLYRLWDRSTPHRNG